VYYRFTFLVVSKLFIQNTYFMLFQATFPYLCSFPNHVNAAAQAAAYFAIYCGLLMRLPSFQDHAVYFE
jgi:hypothetical protein